MAVGNSLTARKNTGISAYLTREAVKNHYRNAQINRSFPVRCWVSR